jgi:hypothetical protein
MPSTSLIPFPRYDGQPLVSYAHLNSKEAPLWNKFLANKQASQYIGFDYDIKVGKYALDAINSPTPENMILLGTMAKRIDVVGFFMPHGVDIFEVKPERITNGLSQLLLYKQLFIQTFPDINVRSMILVSDRNDEEVNSFAKSLDITVVIV